MDKRIENPTINLQFTTVTNVSGRKLGPVSFAIFQ